MTLNVDFDGGDEPESLRKDVNKNLVKLEANFLSVICSDPIQELLFVRDAVWFSRLASGQDCQRAE